MCCRNAAAPVGAAAAASGAAAAAAEVPADVQAAYVAQYLAEVERIRMAAAAAGVEDKKLLMKGVACRTSLQCSVKYTSSFQESLNMLVFSPCRLQSGRSISDGRPCDPLRHTF